MIGEEGCDEGEGGVEFVGIVGNVIAQNKGKKHLLNNLPLLPRQRMIKLHQPLSNLITVAPIIVLGGGCCGGGGGGG